MENKKQISISKKKHFGKSMAEHIAESNAGKSERDENQRKFKTKPVSQDSDFYAKGKTLKGKKKWIKPALSGKKGIVSKFAEKKGIIKAGKDLTLTSIRKVEKVSTGKMKKRAIMAETLIGFNKKRFGEEGMNVSTPKGRVIDYYIQNSDNEDLISLMGVSDMPNLKQMAEKWVNNRDSYYHKIYNAIDGIHNRTWGENKFVELGLEEYANGSTIEGTPIEQMIKRATNEKYVTFIIHSLEEIGFTNSEAVETCQEFNKEIIKYKEELVYPSDVAQKLKEKDNDKYAKGSTIGNGGIDKEIRLVEEAIGDYYGIDKETRSIASADLEKVLQNKKYEALKYEGRYIKTSHREIPKFNEIKSKLRNRGWVIYEKGEYAKGSTITTNEGVIESFLSDKKELKVGNLSTHYSTMGDVVLLRNYGTLIAKRKGKTVSISTKKYSVTTTKIQNMIERIANRMGLKVEKIGEDEFAKGGEMYGYGGEVEGTYGRSKNPSTIFVYKQGRRNWYVAEGSVNVNCTYDDIEDGVDIEELNDVDTFTASKPINSVEDLEMFMDDEEYAKGGGLKSIPKGNKGLPKLPESVRNKMGYMENGSTIEGGYKLTLKRWGADIYEDDYNEGEGKYVNSYGEKENKSFSSGEELLKYISGNITSYDAKKEDYSIMDDGRIVTSILVDEDNSTASKSEIEEWKNGRKKLYSANYNFYITLTQEKTPSEEELSKLIGVSIYEEGGQYRTGGVAGSKHVSVTKGYRLPHGYKAVKGSDKSYTYSKGHKGVKVDAGWRLPKGYEVVDGAYDMKYEHGTTLNDCWSCKLNSNEKEFACSVYNRMITGHPFCNEETLKNCDKKHLLSAIEKNMNSFSNEGKKLATSIVEKIK